MSEALRYTPGYLPRFGPALFASTLLAVSPAPLSAQTAPAPEIRFGGYLETQYNRITNRDGDSRDRAIFRRIIVGVEGDLADRWAGEIQLDFAPATLGERILVRDAYLKYNGLAHRGLAFTLGNQKIPFSRSVLTPSSRRALVERPFTGERAYGSSGRAISFRVDGRNETRSFQWAAALASAHHAPGVEQIRISGLAEASEDWNEGPMFAGRAEWHPLGPVPLEQAAFEVRRLLVTLAAGAYYWRNDGDNNPHTSDGHSTSSRLADLHDSLSVELSGAVRAPRLAVDVEFHRTTGDTIDPLFSAGLYLNGAARLLKSSIEAGYTILPEHFELLGAIDALDAEASERLTWRSALGANWYVFRHRLKFQFMHREEFNAQGVGGHRTRATFLQAHIGF